MRHHLLISYLTEEIERIQPKKVRKKTRPYKVGVDEMIKIDKERFGQYIQYINNASRGNGCVLETHFVEDWEPIGRHVLDDMIFEGVVQISQGVVFLRPDLVEVVRK